MKIKKVTRQSDLEILKRLEAATRIELVNKAFAELCLTTWLRRQTLKQLKRRSGNAVSVAS